MVVRCSKQDRDPSLGLSLYNSPARIILHNVLKFVLIIVHVSLDSSDVSACRLGFSGAAQTGFGCGVF